jgi:MoaA/NifB/PqqE/SkfB family radical SAM enzyme
MGVDIELTNRCNAKCHFCPRDQTPHQGVMSPEVFEQALHRSVELRDAARTVFDTDMNVISLCGLGEPLLNRHAVEFTRMVADAGFECGMSSNGALLDEAKAEQLLDAGLARIYLNVGDRDDDYEDVYKLPFERTRANVARFVELAGDRCEVFMVLVNYRRDKAHLAEMRRYWGELGITRFTEYDIMNRGGALFVDHMQFETLPQRERAEELLESGGTAPFCVTPFLSAFIGYDGRYYLCCADWKKEVPLGGVFDASLVSVMAQKLEHVVTREPLCTTCNIDPVNYVIDELRAADDGEADLVDLPAVIAEMREGSASVLGAMGRLEALVPGATASAPAARRLIPVNPG